MRSLVFVLPAIALLGQTDPSVLAENHVTIPVAEYNRLTDAAAAKRRVDPPPAYVIRGAEFGPHIEPSYQQQNGGSK
ncbi:MAG: hypothetical protein U0Q16_20705 [Bryobacteraceae bacterium]